MTQTEASPADAAPELSEKPAPAPVVEQRVVRVSAGRARIYGPVAAIVTLVSLFGPISASGIWDPFELRVADLARRIALNLLGAKGLALDGSTNTVPTLGELSRGQLPFTSVALGFKLFGLHEWAGRLPLALWGLVGVIATYLVVSRLADRAAAAFSALALATMPLYFLHARTMLGDIVIMASLAIAFAGLALAVFDDQLSPTKRGLALVCGLIGMGTGYGTRGAVIGIAIPALGVGLGWLLLRQTRRSKDGMGSAIALVCLVMGATALALGVRALFRAQPDPTQYSAIIGSAYETQRMYPTFETVIHQLGHALFPWSAFIPLAVGRVLGAPHGIAGSERDREIALRVALILTAALGFGAYTLLTPSVGILPFGAVFAFAAISGLALRDFERGAPGSRTAAMVLAAFAVLFYYDFKNFPEKGLSAFVVEAARFPDSFKKPGDRWLKIATLVCMAFFFASFFERARPNQKRFVLAEYLAWPKALRSQWAGNLWFVFLVAEAALCGYAVLAFLSQTKFHWKQFQTLGSFPRLVAQVGWFVLPLAVILLPPLVILARDLTRWFFDRVPVTRAAVATLGIVLGGLVLSVGYYPALAAQISPKEVFDSYKKHARQGEPLGLLGVGAGSASYYAGRDVPTFDNAASAFQFLNQQNGERRWLVAKASDLPQLNSSYRAVGRGNIPVIDARSSEILLVSNVLAPGEKNQNPFDDAILDQAPQPLHPMVANLGGQVDVLGWDVTDKKGKVVDSVVPSVKYDFVIYYKVVGAISGNWETFIHIDGQQRRFNGDHPTLEGKYPLHLWRVGDFVADRYEFVLEPFFTPGDYDVFFGLYIGSRRLDVKTGRSNDNRLEAGKIRVR
jgi:4-amino-4-deoxy-L-arabinose transferase-like glycosyltransferase